MGLVSRLLAKKQPPPPPPLAAAPDHHAYAIQILVPGRPHLSPAAIHDHLRHWRDDVDLIGEAPGLFGLAVPATSPLPIMIHVATVAFDARTPALADALTWTQTWPGAADAIAACATAIHVSMIADPGEPAAIRLLSLLAVVDTVLVQLDDDVLDAAVLHVVPAQHLVGYGRYRALRKELGPTGPVVNVRIAKVGGGAPGEMFADTLGLAALGLPDLQTRFRGADPDAIALRLMRLAGAVLRGDDLDCAAAEDGSLAPPDRPALTVRLG